MTQTLRDLKESYVLERDKRETNSMPFGSILRDHRIKFFRDSVEELEEDLQQREQNHYDVGFVSSWNERAMNYAIEQVDWDSLHQCKACHKFYDESDAGDTDKFCSDICEEDYEEPVPIDKESKER